MKQRINNDLRIQQGRFKTEQDEILKYNKQGVEGEQMMIWECNEQHSEA